MTSTSAGEEGEELKEQAPWWLRLHGGSASPAGAAVTSQLAAVAVALLHQLHLVVLRGNAFSTGLCRNPPPQVRRLTNASVSWTGRFWFWTGLQVEAVLLC